MQSLFRVFQVFILVVFAGTVAQAEVVKMTPDVARAKALAGEIVLIDIRRPDEWSQTGVPDVALLADMTQRNFLDKIKAIRAQSPNIPLAFTCRTGNRSNYLTEQLERIGMSGIIDVVGGMAGSDVDQGWVKRGLPVRPASVPVNAAISIPQP